MPSKLLLIEINTSMQYKTYRCLQLLVRVIPALRLALGKMDNQCRITIQGCNNHPWKCPESPASRILSKNDVLAAC